MTHVIHFETILVKQKLWKYIEVHLTINSSLAGKGDKLAKAELILIITPSELKQIKNCNTAKDL